ncbi:MAG: hypothetical protein ACK4S2_14685 [Gemmobacter sp.]|uniref:hypothetical protein n=1 Tax=Gemmobacter sp. TaxID=1898957 RepID=UPI00391C68FE
MDDPDHLILCLSQPSLSARDEGRLLAALHRAARAHCAQPVTVVRLEGGGTDLAQALCQARDAETTHVRVMPVGFPMAANIAAWLPGAVAHAAATAGGGLRITLAELPAPEDAAAALVPLALVARATDAATLRPTRGASTAGSSCPISTRISWSAPARAAPSAGRARFWPGCRRRACRTAA